MNLLLVDDHTLFREGLRGLLANISPGVAIHEAASVDEAVDACRVTSFRMVLLDLGLTSTSGLDTLDRFRAGVPDVPVVVLSGDQEPRHVRSALDRGAVGFVPKSHSSDLMIAALRFVLAGGVYLPPHAMDAQPETRRGLVHPALAAPAAGVATAAAGLSQQGDRETARPVRGHGQSARLGDLPDPRRTQSRRGGHDRRQGRHQGDVIGCRDLRHCARARAARSSDDARPAARTRFTDGADSAAGHRLAHRDRLRFPGAGRRRPHAPVGLHPQRHDDPARPVLLLSDSEDRDRAARQARPLRAPGLRHLDPQRRRDGTRASGWWPRTAT